MEIATLFFCLTAERYLKRCGIIAFLMPISVLTASQQHKNFQRFKKPRLKLLKVLNFEHVSEIFSLLPRILIAEKGEKTVYPVQEIDFYGNIGAYRRNQSLATIRHFLTSTEREYSAPAAPRIRHSFYYKYFREGATLVPRNLCFVEFVVHPTFGVHSSTPEVRSSADVDRVAKDDWKNIVLNGYINADFLYATYLGKDLILFGQVGFRPIFVPLIKQASKYTIFDVKYLRDNGFIRSATWLESAQKQWEKHRTAKSAEQYPRLISYFDFMSKLTSQNPNKRYIVLYNARGANAMASVLDQHELTPFEGGEGKITPKGLIMDYTVFYYQTNNQEEAHYLCAFLNSSILNNSVKAFQPKGAYGYRDIGRRPLMRSIPQFDKENSQTWNLQNVVKNVTKSSAQKPFQRYHGKV